MNKNKVIHLLLIILCVTKITDVILALSYNIGKISLEFDSAYYIFAGFNQKIFSEKKSALLTLIITVLMTSLTIVIKYFY